MRPMTDTDEASRQRSIAGVNIGYAQGVYFGVPNFISASNACTRTVAAEYFMLVFNCIDSP